MLRLSSSIYFWNEDRFVKEKEKWKQIRLRPNPNQQGSVAVCLTNADTAVLATGLGDTVSTARFYVEGKAPEHWHPQLELKGEWGGGKVWERTEEVCEALSCPWKHSLQEWGGGMWNSSGKQKLTCMKRHKLGRFWKSTATPSFIKGGNSRSSKRRPTNWAAKRDLDHSCCQQAVQSAPGWQLSWGSPCGFVVMLMVLCHLWSRISSPILLLVTLIKGHWFA